MIEKVNMRIASVGSAFPQHYYSQAVLSAALKKYWGGRLNNPEVVDRMHAHAEVEGRYLSMPIDAYYGVSTWGEFNDAWIECAQELGQQALCRALAGIGLTPQDVDALFVVTVTGVASRDQDHADKDADDDQGSHQLDQSKSLLHDLDKRKYTPRTE